ncbi:MULTISPECIES: flagellar basal body-associated FliL family protein [Niastella]|uniref:DUF4292 domain-containing protein n=1 Tax=Niastella soli TaxID=2821487 RepID=A0ABS3Z1E6_9BACT|nr:hypothetical protein [Niastella soli]MBO9203999.1 hypothetical protein [Niastella soli]
MMKRKIILIIGSIVLLSAAAIAGNWAGWFTKTVTNTELPDAKEEYKRIAERLKNDTAVNIEGLITLYDGEKPGVIKEKTTYRLIKHQDQYYSQFGLLQSFCNGSMVVQLDTTNRVIVVADANDGSGKRKKSMQPSLDVLFDEKADFKITGQIVQNGNNERTISFQDEFRPEIRSYALTYDPATYQVNRATIQWWKDGGAFKESVDTSRIWISQIDYRRLTLVDMNINEEINKIITIKKDQVLPALQFQDYQLHVANPEQ